MPTYRSASGSSAEDLFIELFCDTFGAEKAGYLYSQYPFSDIYQNSRFADFLIENGGRKVAIEIDDEASHNPKLISQNKFYDDLLKQNSMIYLGWDVYRWAVRQMQQQPETVKDETVVLLSKGEIDSKKVRVEFSLEDMDMSGFQKGATYEQIKAYVLKHTGLKVSSLYISQVKRKCGLDVGQNYNLSKKEDAKVPQCPPEKEAAIMDALKHFQMLE